MKKALFGHLRSFYPVYCDVIYAYIVIGGRTALGVRGRNLDGGLHRLLTDSCDDREARGQRPGHHMRNSP